MESKNLTKSPVYIRRRRYGSDYDPQFHQTPDAMHDYYRLTYIWGNKKMLFSRNEPQSERVQLKCTRN